MKRWFPGETVSLGIGQGYNNFTMLQLALAQATLANGGTLPAPHRQGGEGTRSLGHHRTRAPHPRPNWATCRRTWRLVRNALVAVNEGGTGTRVFCRRALHLRRQDGHRPGREPGPEREVQRQGAGGAPARPLALCRFRPAEAPEIAVAVIVENAGFGAAHAAPIARRVFDLLAAGRLPQRGRHQRPCARAQASAPLGKPRKAADIVLPTP